MNELIRADDSHTGILTALAITTFLESHGHSAAPGDINTFIKEKYSKQVMERELREPKNIYHLIYQNNIPAGFSKIIFNTPYEESDTKNITKLERIYLLREFYGKNLGQALFEFNLNLAKENKQAGIWLFVWKENQRAVNFYKKNGFTIVGSHDFQLSPTHSNPNHIMFLSLE